MVTLLRSSWSTSSCSKVCWVRSRQRGCGVQCSLQWVFSSLHWTDWQVTGPSHCRTSAGSQGWGCGGPRYWQSMCLLLGTKWIYPRQQWSILTLMSRPAAFLSPGTSSMNEPLATGERERCQDSMPPCWTDIVLCYYYVFCFTLHLIMYICRSMLPYYYHSFIGFLCCCCCCCCFISFLMYSIFSGSCPSSCVSHLHLYLYSSACSFCQLLMKATWGCRNV